jgi:hypothetical protein
MGRRESGAGSSIALLNAMLAAKNPAIVQSIGGRMTDKPSSQ